MLSANFQKKSETLYYLLKAMVAVLPKRQFNFLACWYDVCGDQDKEFGFIGEFGFKDQSNAAFKFLKKLDTQWTYQIQNNIAQGEFLDFFYTQAEIEGLKLPENFKEQMREKLKILKGVL